ncbi:Isochorismatase-like protein [Diaporthe sp. PMI_573]|nr:Isochorismatase-like protein [Diaporthaceae sp. PMI_573]
MATKKVEVIGGAKNFWLYSEADGYDLTHPPAPDSSPIQPRLLLKTTTGRVTIDPAKTALVVVDLQNYFLSPLLGRPVDSVGMKVVDKLLEHAIPACRKAGIPTVWLGWGLTKQDIEEMPPTIIKGFAADTNFRGDKKVGGLGSEIGPLQLEDGEVIEGGRVMMRDQWNTAFYSRLVDVAEPQDIWVYKNRLSGFWGGTDVEKTLADRGIRTLLFSGANTDQCVGGSLQDAFTKGWDCLMLSDGCATTSPEFCKQCIEFNCEAGWGFVLSCEELADGVDTMHVSAND